MFKILVSLLGTTDMYTNPILLTLEGHHLIANDPHYVKTSEKRLQQEYEKAINHLTINEENRLQRTIETLKVEKSRIDDLEAKIQELEKRHR
jgi:hypothetical protein